ncbi:hypothetical protein NL676_026674 [Syzygium grande]|nr:hypothetical protein NL676_026674 [Syzygium grande]
MGRLGRAEAITGRGSPNAGPKLQLALSRSKRLTREIRNVERQAFAFASQSTARGWEAVASRSVRSSASRGSSQVFPEVPRNGILPLSFFVVAKQIDDRMVQFHIMYDMKLHYCFHV